MPLFSFLKPQELQNKHVKSGSTNVNASKQDHVIRTGHHDERYSDVIEAPEPCYRPLDPSKREIRLLNLHPGQEEDQLVCTFEYTPLASKNHIPYETISYCWGGDPGEFVIEIDQLPAKVTWSAARAIHRMRYPDRHRIVWVDAICINQADYDERSQQVGMMGTIYSQTWRNLVWFGSGKGRSSAVHAALKVVMADVDRKTSNCRKLFDITHEKTGGGNLVRSGTLLGKDTLEHLPALLALFSRTWFGRLWVAQEVALAPANLCHFGSASFDLNIVLRVVIWLRYNARCVPTALIDSGGFNRAMNLWYLVDRQFVPAEISTKHIETLSSAWELLQLMETTKPKDNIYAILGMVRNRTSRSSQLALVPNYKKSDGEVFRDATRIMVEEKRGVTILQVRCDTGNEGHLKMPTWAIRFDLKRHTDPGPRPFAGTHNAHDGHFMKCSTLSSRGGPDVLSVRGVYADRVARRTNCMPSLFKNNIGQLLREALEVIHPDKQKKDTWTPDFTEKFSTTLMAGMNYIGQPAGPQELDDFLVFMKYMSRHRKSPPPAPYAEMDQYEENQQQVLRAFHAIAVACSRRRFFVTTDGRFGLGPGGLADDDLIVVLYGGTTPFALRCIAKGKYRYVGACYVLGMMGGEVMRKHKAERSRDYVFHIE